MHGIAQLHALLFYYAGTCNAKISPKMEFATISNDMVTLGCLGSARVQLSAGKMVNLGGK